jgi:hypothetical protein
VLNLSGARLNTRAGGYKNDWAGTGKSDTFKLTTGTYYYVINIDEGKAIIKGFLTLLN